MRIWHRIEHRFGWYRGSVVSRIDAIGRIFIGFQCSKCGLITCEDDATAMIDAAIEHDKKALGA